MRLATGVVLFLSLLCFKGYAQGESGGNVFIPYRGGTAHIEMIGAPLTLGQFESSTVSVSVPSGAKNVQIMASRGSIQGQSLVKDQAYEATYIPPADFRPSIDVIAVQIQIDEESSWSFATVPLFGQGEAKIKTRPGAKATIKIGENIFGPVGANRKGQARISVIVPPGINEGFDDRGHGVPLHVPPMPTTAVFTGRNTLESNASSKLEIFAVSFLPNGERDRSSSPSIRSEIGSVEGSKEDPSGGVIAYFLPPEFHSGEVEIVASTLDDSSSESRLRVAVVAPEIDTPVAVVPSAEEEPVDMEEGLLKRTFGRLAIFASGSAGGATNFATLNGMKLGLEGGTAFLFKGQLFRAALSTGFVWTRTDDVESSGGGLNAEARTWLVPIQLSLSWQTLIGGPWVFSLGCRLGVAIAGNEMISSQKSAERLDVSLRPVLSVRAETAVRIGSGDLGVALTMDGVPVAPESLPKGFALFGGQFFYRLWFGGLIR